MLDRPDLERTLAQIDGRGCASCTSFSGTCRFGTYRLDIDLDIDPVLVDHFAPPSRTRIILDPDAADLPADLTDDARGRRAVADFLTRRFFDLAHRLMPKPSSIGTSGMVSRP